MKNSGNLYSLSPIEYSNIVGATLAPMHGTWRTGKYILCPKCGHTMFFSKNERSNKCPNRYCDANVILKSSSLSFESLSRRKASSENKKLKAKIKGIRAMKKKMIKMQQRWENAGML